MNPEAAIQQLDAILPQTQCGDCGYSGCIPYATAIIQENAPIDRCLPGGEQTLVEIARQLGREPFEEEIMHLRELEKKPTRVTIRESECIGCTKCISACPVDAIVGTAKRMHSVIQTECTGCLLCIPPCPMDCIDVIELAKPSYDKDLARNRFTARSERLQREQLEKKEQQLALQRITEKKVKQDYIREAILRVQQKRLAKNNE